jgi:hypothetical protein
VRSETSEFAAVVGSTGGSDGVLVIPRETQVTIPGQGDARFEDALQLKPRAAATTAANLLGLWVHHYAIVGPETLVDLIDRAGGITVGGQSTDGASAVAMLDDAGRGATATFGLVLDALLSSGVAWQESDVLRSDDPPVVVDLLAAAAEAPVAALPVVEAAEDIFRAEPETIRATLVGVFGGPDREVVDVIVLNGSGAPAAGADVAERIVPAGFRVVVSENASTFDHEETLVVVGSADDVALGERVRDLLGTGSVNVSVSSGIAPVTVVIGKDLGV